MRNLLALAGVLLTAACSSTSATGNDGAGGGGDFAGGNGDLAGGDFAGVDLASSGGDLLMGPFIGASVLQHHNSPTRDGVYVDPLITLAAAATMHVDTTFNAATNAQSYAQLLYVDKGPGGTDLVIAATEANDVFAFNASTGAVVWHTDAAVIGTPATSSGLPCGNIAPTLGITGTPAIDLASRTIFFSAETETAAGANPYHQMIWALDVDTGSKRTGWPVDVSVQFPGFDSSVQNGRGAVIVVNGVLYAPFGGMAGDCGAYHGYVIGVPINNPSAATEWHVSAPKGGIWAPSGLSSDGTSLYATTGNAPPGTTPFGNENSIIKLGAGPTFSGNSADIYTPTDWTTLDTNDTDISGTGAIVFDMPGPLHLLIGLGKDGKAYLLDRANFGGMGGGLIATPPRVGSGAIINAAVVYTTALGTYVAFKGGGQKCPAGQSGKLTAIQISPMSPMIPADGQAAWCANQRGDGSPMVTTTDGKANAIVWAVGTECCNNNAPGDFRLHGFNADTGAVVFNGGGAGDLMSTVRRFSTPIAAKGRIFVAADNQVYAFKP